MFSKAFGAIALTAGVLAASGAEIEIKHPLYRFEVEQGKAVIRDSGGNPLLELGNLRIGWGSPQAGVGVSAEKLDAETVKVTYRSENDPEGLVAFDALYTVKPEGVKAEYALTAPEKMNVGGTQLTVRPLAGTRKGDLYKSGLWTRPEGNGVSYEANDGYYRLFAGKQADLYMLVTGNHGWNDVTSQHLNFKPKAKGDRERFAETFFFVTPKGLSGGAAAAYRQGRPLALSLESAKPFHWFETGEAPAEFRLTVEATRPIAKAAVTVTARDFDGKVVLEEKKSFTADAFGRESWSFQLPAAERNLYFIEAVAKVEGKELFTRTNLAVLPPFEFKHRNEGIFGIAAFFQLPSEGEAFRLMERLGVRHLRQYDNRVARKHGMEAFYHANVSVNIKPEEWAKARDRFLGEIKKNECPAFEFGNEWNMNKPREESIRRANIYTGLCRDLRQARDAAGMDFKIISQGMVNQYPAFVRDLYDAGCWELLDAVAWHTGRGNLTPDCPKGTWNYLGSIRSLKKLLKEFGEKPIYITEAYAKTKPNDFWHDSYRQAAENVILSFAIGLAEGVEAIHWYQLNDAVWSDVGGVNPNDGEYHYGLLMRDLSFKPSAMAYAAAAEALGGAKFRRWYEGEGNVRGLLFDTPRGELAILFDRTDGFQLSKKGPETRPEPWAESWKSRVAASFPCRGEGATAIDPIGRETKIPARGGKVSLTLTGAPLMVYNLNLK